MAREDSDGGSGEEREGGRGGGGLARADDGGRRGGERESGRGGSGLARQDSEGGRGSGEERERGRGGSGVAREGGGGRGNAARDDRPVVAREGGRGGVLGRARGAQDALARKSGRGLAASGRAGGRWVREAVAAAPEPRVPWSGPWKCTLAGILVRRPGSPLLTIRPLTALDRFGALHLDTEEVGFDGAPKEWQRVTGLRLREAFELLTTDALEREVSGIRRMFPPIPGRRRALTYLAENLATVLLAALDQDGDALGRAVVGELRHRGRAGARHVERPGLFAAALLSLRPDFGEALLAEAGRHGVPVTRATSERPPPADRDARIARVAVLRRRTEALVARLAEDAPEPERPAIAAPEDEDQQLHLRAHP